MSVSGPHSSGHVSASANPPTGPGKATAPVTPAGPVTPATPGGPARPIGPATRSGSTHPIRPVTPATPPALVSKATPAGHRAPADPVTPASREASAARAPRADARRNREQILAAARELLREPGDLKLNLVAKAAGVGQGTLYRHFPTREDLLAEVYRQDVDELVAAAPALLRSHPPLVALGRWFERVAAYARIKRDVFAAVEAATWQGLAAHSLGPIGEAVQLLLDAGRADGSIRADAEARDVIILISWLSRLDDAELDDRCTRLLAILVDGLRA